MSEMTIEETIEKQITGLLCDVYQVETENLPPVNLQLTRKDFKGDLTLVVFPYLKISGKGPEQTASEIGQHILNKIESIQDFNVIKGFLNLELKSDTLVDWLKNKNLNGEAQTERAGKVQNVMVEYSSPNTNKPLHLGHIRNNLLGYSVSEIIKENGHGVNKVQVINDRGIHICKSMLAWLKYGNNESPEGSGKKGDHLVGDYYVLFDKEYKKQIEAMVAAGTDRVVAEKTAGILIEAQEMLRKWEAGDAEVRSLWKKMNSWVYDGFEITYKNLGVDFDRVYFESETYLVGKEEVMKGLAKGIFYQKEDGSVWIDLTDVGLDHKLLIRSDGTSVYMTQDIGTAILRNRDFPGLTSMIYTVGDEQNYHFKVLFQILNKLGFEWAKNCRHLSYGMVELPSGKMKSREGTVVDADDLMEEMLETARIKSEELGKVEGMTETEKKALYRMIGMGALKYFILKVDPKKQIVFNPEESIEFAGNTGPFIQYTHARIKTLLSRSAATDYPFGKVEISDLEKEIIKLLQLYDTILKQAMEELSPAIVANHIYELVKTYNQFYQTIPILKESDVELRNFRLRLSEVTAFQINESMKLFGIDVPERM